MTDSLFAVLTLAAVTIGSVHSLAPDHWVPFAALARAQKWSVGRTAGITALCGFGHVTVSVLFGLLGLVFGVELLRAFGQRMEAIAGLLLIGFGLAYALWSLRRAATTRLHGHGNDDGGLRALGHRLRAAGDGLRASGRGLASGAHAHHHHHYFDHEHEGHRLTPWTLFLLFCADPCVAVVPLMFAAAPLGVARTITVVCAYETATIGTMVALVVPAQLATRRVRGAWFERFGDAVAGGIIACVGVAVAALGW